MDSGREETSLTRKLASVGAELAAEAAKEAAGEAVGTVFSFGYMLVLTAVSIVILIGVLVVFVGGWAVTTLALANVPEARGFIAPFWGLVALVLLFFGIRWAVRRFGRPIERRAEHAVGTIHQAIDSHVGGFSASSAASANAVTATRVPAATPISAPTLAELDARLAPKPGAPPEE